MAKKKTDWGVPDWRDADAYPKKLDPRLWRWEFARRRPDYRATWEQASRRATVPGTRFPHEPAEAAQYGLLHLINPRFSAHDLQDRDLVDFYFLPAAINPKHPIITIPFDLYAPAGAQINHAARILRGLQDKARAAGKRIEGERPQREKWPLYLRVLDAREHAEVAFRTIAVELLDCRAPDSSMTPAKYDQQQNRVEQAEARAAIFYKQACGIRDLLP